jgi:metal-dependent HD superfamily phosphatase/phosphodiesterase
MLKFEIILKIIIKCIEYRSIHVSITSVSANKFFKYCLKGYRKPFKVSTLLSQWRNELKVKDRAQVENILKEQIKTSNLKNHIEIMKAINTRLENFLENLLKENGLSCGCII